MDEVLERFRFVGDDDGHRYLIPAGSRDDFQTWLDAGPYWENYEGVDFTEYRCDSPSLYTFTNPKRES